MYVRMYVRTYVRTYVRVYVCTGGRGWRLFNHAVRGVGGMGGRGRGHLCAGCAECAVVAVSMYVCPHINTHVLRAGHNFRATPGTCCLREGRRRRGARGSGGVQYCRTLDCSALGSGGPRARGFLRAPPLGQCTSAADGCRPTAVGHRPRRWPGSLAAAPTRAGRRPAWVGSAVGRAR